MPVRRRSTETMTKQRLGHLLIEHSIMLLKGAIDDGMLRSFSQQLHTVSRGDGLVVILLSTPGGGVEEGMILYRALEALAHVREIWLGAVASVQSFGLPLMMAVPAEQRFAYPDTLFYAHRTTISGDIHFAGDTATHEYQLRERQANLEAHLQRQRVMEEIICRGTGMSKRQVKKLCDEPRMLSAAEALELGFVSKIITQ